MLFWWAISAAWYGPAAILGACWSTYAGLAVLLVGNGLSLLGGFETLAYDITLFVLSALFGQYAGLVAFTTRADAGWSLGLLGLMVAALLIFTNYPITTVPYLFEDRRNHTFGMPAECPALPFGQFK
jgi:hypothetical protein